MATGQPSFTAYESIICVETCLPFGDEVNTDRIHAEIEASVRGGVYTPPVMLRCSGEEKPQDARNVFLSRTLNLLQDFVCDMERTHGVQYWCDRPHEEQVGDFACYLRESSRPQFS